MAVDTSFWGLDPNGPGLLWGGPADPNTGGAPSIPWSLGSKIKDALGSLGGTGSGASAVEGGLELPSFEMGSSGITSAPIGPQLGSLNDLWTSLLGGATGDGTSELAKLLWGQASGSASTNPLMDFFMSALGGGATASGSTTAAGQSTLANDLYGLASGVLPTKTADTINAKVAESYRGSRFGTDEAGAAAYGLGKASEEQQLNAFNTLFGVGKAASDKETSDNTSKLAALAQILGVGTNTATLEFTAGQNDLERALKEFLGSSDPTLQLLGLLLSQQAG